LEIFGPVPSRRLGNSLGINNIPYKKCSYSCTYCQVGRTQGYTITPESFYEPSHIISGIEDKVREVWDSGESIDFLTFVPDGEPTLDENLGNIVNGIGYLEIPIGIISNATTLGIQAVWDTLLRLDWVSLKIDSTIDTIWRRINRPSDTLDIMEIQKNILKFREVFAGTLVTESMLVHEINDSEPCIMALAQFLGQLAPECSYLSIPIRPPAEDTAIPPDETAVAAAYSTISQYVKRVECLFGHEGNVFHSSGNPREDLLSITAVHPMRRAAVTRLLDKTDSGWSVMGELIKEGMMKEVDFNGERFYLRAHRKT
jgi:wyosine [tRNA(Phe)-imidazoG37] synthetase (radical SAM superfamily)